MCLLVNPLVTLHFFLSHPTGAMMANRVEDQDQEVASTRMWLRTRVSKTVQERVNLLVTLKNGGEGSKSCQGKVETTQVFWLTTKSRPTFKARRVSLLGYSTCQNMQEEEWQSGRAGKTVLLVVVLLLAGTKAKPTTTIPFHTHWPRLLLVALHNVHPR